MAPKALTLTLAERIQRNEEAQSARCQCGDRQAGRDEGPRRERAPPNDERDQDERRQTLVSFSHHLFFNFEDTLRLSTFCVKLN